MAELSAHTDHTRCRTHPDPDVHGQRSLRTSGHPSCLHTDKVPEPRRSPCPRLRGTGSPRRVLTDGRTGTPPSDLTAKALEATDSHANTHVSETGHGTHRDPSHAPPHTRQGGTVTGLVGSPPGTLMGTTWQPGGLHAPCERAGCGVTEASANHWVTGSVTEVSVRTRGGHNPATGNGAAAATLTEVLEDTLRAAGETAAGWRRNEVWRPSRRSSELHLLTRGHVRLLPEAPHIPGRLREASAPRCTVSGACDLQPIQSLPRTPPGARTCQGPGAERGLWAGRREPGVSPTAHPARFRDDAPDFPVSLSETPAPSHRP